MHSQVGHSIQLFLKEEKKKQQKEIGWALNSETTSYLSKP